jgi:3-(3-hydroxy-phenyl)propionate hydroxylase/6-hydroxy-3-succinoylpyridine 3-monooxygenase
VHYGTRVTTVRQDAEGVCVTAEVKGAAREFRSAWLVGADGARSAVRESIGLKLDGFTWPDRFVATNVVYDFSELGYRDASLQIDPDFGAIVAMIDKKRNLWRCTYREAGDLPESGIPGRMEQWFRKMLPPQRPQYELLHFSPYRMHQRAVDRMRVGRVLVAGDAAHLTNPTGGLGLTSGLFDLYVLYEALAAVIRREADDSVLDTWSAERLKAFTEIASPAATRLKRLLFDTPDAKELEPSLARFREMAATPGGGKALFSTAKMLQTASVLGR